MTDTWSTFAGWARNGVVGALDMADTYMSPHHVYQGAWHALAAKIDRKCRDFTGYVNSGHVGIDRQFAELAEVGALLMEELAREERGYEQNEELGRKTRIRAFGSRRAERYDHGDTDADHTPRRRSDGMVSRDR